MTIKDLYNALEKAIDSGEATVETEILTESGYGPLLTQPEKAEMYDKYFIISK